MLNSILYYLAGVLSEQVWGRLPGSMQQRVSALAGKFFKTSASRVLIKPYCRAHYGDAHYFRHFRPGGGSDSYRTFQDFFTRDFIVPPRIDTPNVWPCEGYLCDKARIGDLNIVKVKRDRRHVREIFGEEGASEISNQDFFSNVFLHNRNYHHIHAPVSGTVRWVKRIPGELLLLRPWAYRQKPSLPAFTNERVNASIRDEQGRDWFLSIVGGPVVGSIRLLECLRSGGSVFVGQKLATFELGSTCCIVSPVEPLAALGDNVSVGEDLSGEEIMRPSVNEL